MTRVRLQRYTDRFKDQLQHKIFSCENTTAVMHKNSILIAEYVPMALREGDISINISWKNSFPLSCFIFDSIYHFGKSAQ